MAITLAQAAALYGFPVGDPEPDPEHSDDLDVPTVTDHQLRHIWGYLNALPGARPLSAALEQALESARREYPGDFDA